MHGQNNIKHALNVFLWNHMQIILGDLRLK